MQTNIYNEFIINYLEKKWNIKLLSKQDVFSSQTTEHPRNAGSKSKHQPLFCTNQTL